MKIVLTACIAALATPALADSNNNDGPIGSKSIDWYFEHPKERQQQLDWCNEQSMSVQMDSQACNQAGRALNKVMAGVGQPIPRVIVKP